jgi:hypothetical protein
LVSPEAALTEEEASRECCIEAMYEVIYDLVANHMGLSRRHRYTAQKDAEIFQYILRGYGAAAITHELEIAERTANQRVQFARNRLEQVMTKQGLETVAGRYSNVASRHLSHRKARRLVAEEVQRRSEVHLQQYGKPPAKRTVHTWKKETYTALTTR